LIAHILGGKGPCVHASAEATAAATALRQLSGPLGKSSATPNQANSSIKRTASMSSLPDSQPAKKSKQTSLLPHAFKGIDMPFNPSEAEAVRAQALRAVISANLVI
jgi:hypothetical protein